MRGPRNMIVWQWGMQRNLSVRWFAWRIQVKMFGCHDTATPRLPDFQSRSALDFDEEASAIFLLSGILRARGRMIGQPFRDGVQEDSDSG
jgi:hypothetical protein